MTAATGSARDAARAWLVAYLTDGKWHAAVHAKAAGARMGHGRDTLQVLARECCERERREGHFAYWCLCIARRAAWFSPALEGRDAT